MYRHTGGPIRSELEESTPVADLVTLQAEGYPGYGDFLQRTRCDSAAAASDPAVNEQLKCVNSQRTPRGDSL